MEQEYSRFLTKVNGLDFNGSVLYGLKTDDVVLLRFMVSLSIIKIWV